MRARAWSRPSARAEDDEAQKESAGESRHLAGRAPSRSATRCRSGYRYQLTAPAGRNFDPEFRPQLTPQQMLALGVFCGKYMTDCRERISRRAGSPRAKLSPQRRDCSLNFFGVDASQPLSVWRDKGWIHPDDPRGWFQWYCRYYMGRRMPDEDRRQIGRWKAIRRHVSADREELRAGRPLLPPAPAAGAAALGLRQPEDLTRVAERPARVIPGRATARTRNPSFRCFRISSPGEFRTAASRLPE